MSVEYPLTDAQERALIALSNHHAMHGPEQWTKPPGVQAPTLYRLATLGFAETREYPMTTLARITDEGSELLRSMGD